MGFFIFKHVLCWFGDDQNFQEEENYLSRKLKYGQTYNKVKGSVFEFGWKKKIGILIFREGLSGSMESMEVSNFDHDFLHMVGKEGFFAF